MMDLHSEMCPVCTITASVEWGKCSRVCVCAAVQRTSGLCTVDRLGLLVDRLLFVLVVEGRAAPLWIREGKAQAAAVVRGPPKGRRRHENAIINETAIGYILYASASLLPLASDA